MSTNAEKRPDRADDIVGSLVELAYSVRDGDPSAAAAAATRIAVILREAIPALSSPSPDALPEPTFTDQPTSTPLGTEERGDG